MPRLGTAIAMRDSSTAIVEPLAPMKQQRVTMELANGLEIKCVMKLINITIKYFLLTAMLIN